ncbi:hypothetical protein Nmel_009254 [Mimus melanotis]
MASAGRRQRWRKRRETGQADAQEKEDSVKSLDYIERLARKYMQKCTVESSTESESESRAEGDEAGKKQYFRKKNAKKVLVVNLQQLWSSGISTALGGEPLTIPFGGDKSSSVAVAVSYGYW